jgi:hypothetical protein
VQQANSQADEDYVDRITRLRIQACLAGSFNHCLHMAAGNELELPARQVCSTHYVHQNWTDVQFAVVANFAL